jgi:glycosyltransferase involved in cell wall biosynthesis
MQKANILVDLDRLKDLTTGLGQVAYHLGRVLSLIQDDTLRFTFLVPEAFNGYFGDKVDYEVISFRRRHFPALCKRYDLWYTIHQDSRLFPDRNTPYVLTINDLNFLGEKSPAKSRHRLSVLQKKVDRARVITTISEFTASTVKANLKTGNIPVEVIYCGVEVEEFPAAARPAFAPDGDLLFSIGVIQPKKNFRVLLDFMTHIPENYKLIIAGNKAGDYSVELENRIAELGLGQRVFLPGKISDEDKYWMYTHCEAVLFPSKFEGMGFPPVEAMRFGKPVFASTWSSIPEVSGDKAFYWENFEPDYMASVFLENIAKFRADPGRPAILRQHSMKYTWEACAASYIRLFKSVLSGAAGRG